MLSSSRDASYRIHIAARHTAATTRCGRGRCEAARGITQAARRAGDLGRRGRALTEAIVDKGADYILAVKENHPHLHVALEVAFAEVPGKEDESLVEGEHVTEGTAHGRIERRRVRVTRNINWIDGIDAWKGVKTIIEVERTRTIDGKTSLERSYFISSLKLARRRSGTVFALTGGSRTPCTGPWTSRMARTSPVSAIGMAQPI